MRGLVSYILVCGSIFISSTNYAQTEASRIKVIKISESIYKFFVDDFVNMIAFVGPDGVMLIDSGFEENTEEVKSILKKLGYHDIKYIINTHSDYDHIAGNRSLRDNAIIIAHENCIDQMLIYMEPTFEIPFDKKVFEEGLPVISFKDQMIIHFNGEEIHLIPLIGGHTDEDIIVHLKNSGVICVGDIILPESFPHVKVENGGRVNTLIANIDFMIEKFAEDELLVSGHGNNMKVSDLNVYRKMVFETSELVHNALIEGKDVEQMIEGKILKNWESWNSKMFPDDLNTESWIENIFDSWKSELVK